MTDPAPPRWHRPALVAGGIVGVLILSIIGGYFGAGLRSTPAARAVRLPSIVQLVPRRPDAPSDADLVKSACPSVVKVTTGQSGVNPVSVPGVIVSRQGAILTSDAGNATDQATVLLSGGDTLPAKLLATDPLAGLALYQIDQDASPALDIPAVEFPPVGTRLLALAAPNGSGCAMAPLTVGSDFITDGGALQVYLAPIPVPPAAFAGGPVIDGNGQLAGMLVASDDTGGARILPATVLAPIVSELLRTRAAGPNRIGLEIGEISPALADRLGYGRRSGAMVAIADDKGPAAKAGLRAGDIILSINGQPVSSASEAGRALVDTGPIAIEALRGTQRLDVTLGKPAASARARRR
ncbi:hypothetical protein SCH01S_21_00950 [Sphingomonas changbaiensis NBRC 104936]|uniref:PDZ domain-containing protein n=1 Tax=Sphingomonas changbaiensis NBRC 104936 TaxID=1219043 RepID=A0A0E9MN40_9SPHN|nr:PDZ domain-containing protein [Sphingomonas changbaiensis]GAO38908.1 hypothetical protein SCH01S_21_00950 [Sphingomonas changbaiensis NBRC 104936]